MGLFGKIFGGGGGQPPPRVPPAGEGPPRRRRDDAAYGQPLGAAQTDAGPFPKRLRLRAIYSDYDLLGSWKVVTLNSPADWPAAREEVLQGYYQQFGLIRLPGGSSAIRWNEGTWRGLRETLDVVFDPAFAPSADTSGSPTA